MARVDLFPMCGRNRGRGIVGPNSSLCLGGRQWQLVEPFPCAWKGEMDMLRPFSCVWKGETDIARHFFVCKMERRACMGINGQPTDS